jgi:phosphonate transport system substrate-binding protein
MGKGRLGGQDLALALGLGLVASQVCLAPIGPAFGQAFKPQLGCLGDRQRPGRPIRVSVVPQRPPAETFAVWTPLLQQLGQVSKQCFVLRVAPTIPTFEAELRSDRADCVYMNPYHAVLAQRWRGYIPLVRDGSKPLRGLLVVRKDSPIRSIRELNGQAVAFPSPNAFAATLLPRVLLARQGITIQPVFENTHSNVYRSVALGMLPAGGGINNTLRRERPELREELRVLWQTPPFPSHPFACLPSMAQARREALQAGFLTLATNPANHGLLDAIQIPEPVRADFRRDYQALLGLGLERFAVLGSN